ncbi:MAG: cupin domain-containing protein [Firmicutes bacterium]|nr:cupin domain-containing protein [Bacillota bacterium]
MENLKYLCSRIKDLREFSGYTAKEFALKLNLTEAEYLEYEGGKKDFSIGLFYSIAHALMLEPGVLLSGKEANITTATVVYNGKGKEVERAEGYSFVSLNSDFADSRFQPMLVTIKAGGTPELVKHAGHEFNYVVKGSLRIVIGEKKEFYLKEGDSIYFDASQPHAQIAMSDEAKFLTIIEAKL